MKLIDKDAVVAQANIDISNCRIAEQEGILTEFGRGKLEALEGIVDFIDTLEVKDVYSIWNDARKTIPEDSSNQIICIKEDDLAVSTIGKLVRGTKKWAYLNDLLNISDVEVKEVDLEKEWKEYFKYRGDVATVNLKHLARHFFELGLKTQKGE